MYDVGRGCEVTVSSDDINIKPRRPRTFGTRQSRVRTRFTRSGAVQSHLKLINILYYVRELNLQ